MTLILRAVPDHRPAPEPLPVPTPPDDQPMLELLSPVPRAPVRTSIDPDPTWQLARGLCHAVVEVLIGRRPATQLERWATAEVIADLHVAARRRRGRALRVGSVRVQRPRPEVIEVTLRVDHSPGLTRSAAIALQLLRQGQRWMCSAVELGPELSHASRDTS